MLNKFKNFFYVIYILICMMGATINLNPSIGFFDSFVYDTFSLLILIIIFLFSMKSIKMDKYKRNVVIIISLLISLMHLIGYGIYYYGNLDFIFLCKGAFAKSVLKLMFYSYMYYFVFSNLYYYFDNKKINDFKKCNLLDSSRKSFFIRVLLIFLLYLPYLLHNYPGIFTTDSIAEMVNAKNDLGHLVNHYSVTHIYVISLFLHIGLLFKSINLGILLYSISQMILTSFTFSYVISFLDKQNISRITKVLVFLLILLYPPFASYSITMWKDVPFALFLIYFVVQIYYIYTDKEYLLRKKNIFKVIIISLLVILFRNNGIYVVLLSFLGFTIFTNGMRKKLLLITLIIFGFYIMWKGPIFSLLNITDGPNREVLSVPIQQISRVYAFKESDLDENVKDDIHLWIQNEDIKNNYYPYISDNMKDTFNDELFKKDKIGFFKLWFKLFIKYPKIYFESYFLGSIGYWYPEVSNWIIVDWFDYDANNVLNYEKKRIVNIPIIESISVGVNERKIPILSLLFSIGLMFWVLIMLLGYVIYSKNYKLISIFIPILFLWLTTTASPVWCEYRYIYGLFTTMIVIFPIVFEKSSFADKKKIKKV